MRKLVIIGAGALGRMAYSYARDAYRETIGYRGFLDSRTEILDGFVGYPPIISSVEDYSPQDEDVFLIALGDPATKLSYVEKLRDKRVRFLTVIHPTAYVGQNVTVGEGTIIAPHVTITNDTRIGRHVLIGPNAAIGHDIRIDDGVSISPGCQVTGWGHVCAGSFLGVHSAVVPHCEIGSESAVFVAAGAVVTKSYGSGMLMGIPARPR